MRVILCGMATLSSEDGDLVLRLSRWEKLGALRGDVHVRLGAVEDVSVSPAPFRELRGMRMPGTGLPGVVALGTWRYGAGKDFAALYRGKPAVIVSMRDGAYRRLLVSAEDAEAVAAAI
jgi:hypothetical protein